MGREVAPLLDLVKGVASPYIKFPKVSFDINTITTITTVTTITTITTISTITTITSIIFLTTIKIVDITYAHQIWVDNYVFRLHCKLTALILFLSCTLGEI